MMSNRPAEKRVLLVDDELGQREAIGLLLALDGHRVVQAANGQEALEHLGRESFDLVITDYSMPGMAGDELASCATDHHDHRPQLRDEGGREPGGCCAHKAFRTGGIPPNCCKPPRSCTLYEGAKKWI